MDYKKHYQSLIKKHGNKKKKPEFYVERHHIIPKCIGGSDKENNLVYLTPKAYFTAHFLL